MKSFWGSEGGITLSIGIVDMGVFIFQYSTQMSIYLNQKLKEKKPKRKRTETEDDDVNEAELNKSLESSKYIKYRGGAIVVSKEKIRKVQPYFNRLSMQ